MKIKELYDIIEHTSICLYTIKDNQYEILCMPSIRNGEDNYVKEVRKFRALAQANEYVVKKISLADCSLTQPAEIRVLCMKEAE